MQEYVKYSVVWGNIQQNVKYVLSKMSEREHPELMDEIKRWRDLKEICAAMGISDFYREHRHRLGNDSVNNINRKRKAIEEKMEEEG